MAVDPAVLPDLAPAAKAELGDFYALRGYQPAWNLFDDAGIAKARAFIDSIGTLIAYHGLDEGAYPLDIMRKLAASGEDADRRRLELLISASLLRLAHDLHGDTVDLDTLYAGWNFRRRSADIPALLNAAITDGTLEKTIDGLAPQNDSYRALAEALQNYNRIAARGGWPDIAPGPVLLPHDRNPRIAQLRARLAAENDAPPAQDAKNDDFDGALEKALIAYQSSNGLSPDGHLGPKTVEALNTPIATRIAQIRANMERRRHMPEDFPPARYTQINIPDFSILIVEDGRESYRGIVIDGMPSRKTPFIASKITNALFNPSWHVPVKIARKDILPKLRKDPHYLEKLGIVIAGREEDPSGTTIDWKHMDDDDFNYQLRQNPGDLNSLGKLKFNFANPFDVYMHGTPHQELFGKAERDFSSGCVRLEDPVRVGEIFLQYTPHT